MALGRGVQLLISIVGETAGLQKAFGEAGEEVKGFGGINLATAAKVSVVAGAAVAAGAAIWDMSKAAAADRDEALKLETAIAAAGAATATSTAQVEAAIAAGQQKAFTDSETREALQSLVTVTGDVGAATEQLAMAQDIARFAGVDLATASDAVAKAQTGSAGALQRLIPGLKKGASGYETVQLAAAAAAGQADQFANSTEGMEAKAGDAFGELSEEIGSVFLPILDAIMPAVVPIIQAFGKLIKAILPILTPLIKALGSAIKIVADILVRLIDILASVLGWINKLLDPVRELVSGLGKLNPFSGFQLPSFGSASAGVGATAYGATPTISGANSGGVVINIHGDPSVIEAKVTKALRDYVRRNGAGSVFTPGRI